MNQDEKIGDRLPLKIHVFYLLKTTAQGFSLLQIKNRVLFPMLYEVNDCVIYELIMHIKVLVWIVLCARYQK